MEKKVHDMGELRRRYRYTRRTGYWWTFARRERRRIRAIRQARYGSAKLLSAAYPLCGLHLCTNNAGIKISLPWENTTLL
jgi:hypothetical protein